MSTIYKIFAPITETLGEFITKYNDSLDNLNADKLEVSAIAGKQDTLVSGTNIKTINTLSIVGSGNLSIPALTDGDKGDIAVSGSGLVWTVDPNAVTNAKLAQVTTATIKGRTTAGTGNVEDLTTAQVLGMLPTATTSTAGIMSASDKTKLDAIPALIGVKCTTSSAQTIFDNSLDLLNFNSEEFDTDDFHNNITNNSRITIPTGKGGLYQVIGQYRSATGVTPTSNTGFALMIYKNGVSTGFAQQKNGQVITGFSEAGLQVSGVLSLADGDYIDLYVSQRGLASNTSTTPAGQFFIAYKIG